MKLLKAEWIRLKKKKAIYILPMIPMIRGFSFIFSHYVFANELHQMEPDPQVPFSGESFTILLHWLRFDHIFVYTMEDILSTIYFFPLVLVGVLWIYDDLKHNILPRVSVLHRQKARYFGNKIISLVLYYAVVLLFYLLTFTMTSLLIPNVPAGELSVLLSADTAKAFFIYYIACVFWGIAAMLITFVFNSAIAGATIVPFYLLVERVFTAATSHTFQLPWLMYVNSYLPWANFQSLFVYAFTDNWFWNDLSEPGPWLVLSYPQPGMYRLEEVTQGFMLPVPYLASIWFLITVIAVYLAAIIYLCWRLYLYRMAKS
ncbi:hypothetical protein [Caldalkalibacillus thermarum]|uniref:hypothetical protein n=1 Tax=Caldalkalibacillus thermarum TaxID=296745 RepID=UPI001663160C|nr:hypothetical protein [Caldalkalibacillus thermarum]